MHDYSRETPSQPPKELESVTMVRRVGRVPLETPYAEVPGLTGRALRELPERATKTIPVDATGWTRWFLKG